MNNRRLNEMIAGVHGVAMRLSVCGKPQIHIYTLCTYDGLRDLSVTSCGHCIERPSERETNITGGWTTCGRHLTDESRPRRNVISRTCRLHVCLSLYRQYATVRQFVYTYRHNDFWCCPSSTRRTRHQRVRRIAGGGDGEVYTAATPTATRRIILYDNSSRVSFRKTRGKSI